MESLLRDLRLAVRGLFSNPGFAGVAIFCSALGIGASVTIFSFLDPLLLRPVAYPEPERIVGLFNRFSNLGVDQGPLSGHELFDLRDHVQSFDEVGAVVPTILNLAPTAESGGGEPEQLKVGRASANLFDLLGVKPAVGRTFTPEEDRFGENRVALLSHPFWLRRFGGARDVVGKKLLLDGAPFEVVGVMPPRYRLGNNDHDLWIPLAPNLDNIPPRDARGLLVFAHLKDGVTLERAQAELGVEAQRWITEFPTYYTAESGYGLVAVPVVEVAVGKIAPTLVFLGATVGLVLLIACANVASLLLARALAREREMAVRTAMGASRRDLLRQLLVESAVLALLGGAVGALFATWGVAALAATVPATRLPGIVDVAVSGRVLGFSILISLASGLLFGLAPAIGALRTKPSAVLKEGGRTVAGKRPLRSLLVAAEVALATVVLIAAGLLARSLFSLQKVDPGFEADGLLTAPLILPPAQYPTPEKRGAFFNDLLDRMRAAPGVQGAAGVTALPMLFGGATAVVQEEGRGEDDAGQLASVRRATSGYFATMAIPFREGTDFSASDGLGSKSIILDVLTAKELWPGASAIGRSVTVRTSLGGTTSHSVIGVVESIRNTGLAGEMNPLVYLPYAAAPEPLLAIAIRSTGDPAALAPALRRAVAEIDPTQPLGDILPMNERIAQTLSRPRLAGFLGVGFGAVALVLAVVGVYGVIAYAARSRRREIAVRMALGARRIDAVGLIVRQGILLVGSGVVLGLGLAVLVVRLYAGKLGEFLFGIGVYDPWTFVGVPLALIVCGLLASAIPAFFAARTSPGLALRGE